MIKTIVIFLILLVMLASGCTDPNQTVKNENEQLKIKISELEKTLIDKNTKIDDLQLIDSGHIGISYMQNTNSKSLVEKQCDILGLPIDNSIRLNHIEENTVITIIDTANVGDIIWYYVSIPVYDTPINTKGWIKESDTVLYTKDKVKSVQGNVSIKEGADVYEVFEFSKIKTTTPYKAEDYLRGRIEEKREGYARLNCPGGNTIWVKEASIIYPEVD